MGDDNNNNRKTKVLLHFFKGHCKVEAEKNCGIPPRLLCILGFLMQLGTR